MIKEIQKQISVSDHKRFACFEYESETSPGYQLGDILYKEYDWEDEETGETQEPEVGVVIQTFSDGDVRTDMWGMSCDSEVSPATLVQIKKYRPKLMEFLLIK
jgi:hypothetical protein